MRRTTSAHKQALHHGIWAVMVIGVGVIVGFLVTEAVARASNLFEKIAYERVENATHEINRDIRPLEPTKSYYIVGSAEEPEIDAEAYLVADIETGQILLSQSSKISYPIASITKLMTALIAEEEYAPDEIIKISTAALETEGFSGQFTKGQELEVDEILYPLLLVSSNDAGEAIAQKENRDAFIKKMNDRARELGLVQTHFNDPTGLSALNTSTAEELFLFLQFLYTQRSEIIDITNADYYSKDQQVWENKSHLRDEETYFGGKTGFTSKARLTGAGIYNIPLSGNETKTMGIIILKSNERENDIRNLINYLQKYIHYGTPESLNELRADL